jgi:hypothetical protein
MADPITLLAVGSTVLNVGGQLASSKAAHENALESRHIYRERAKDERVKSQQKMFRERYEGELIASRALAVASATGGGAHDPATMDILSEIGAESEYRQQASIYEGEENARILEMGGEASYKEGMAKSNAYLLKGLGGALEGAASIYTKYAKKPFAPSADHSGSYGPYASGYRLNRGY